MRDKHVYMARMLELMGRHVVVTQVTRRSHAVKWGVVKYVQKDIKPRMGWITGVRWYRDGYKECYTDEGCYFIASGPAVPHFLVCFWPNQNAVKVPLNGCRLADGEESAPLWDGMWNAESRKEQSDIMKDEAPRLPRDEKGRFISGALLPIPSPPKGAEK